MIGNRPRQQKKKGPQGTGRRIIGQNPGHEIYLEIEDVLDTHTHKNSVLGKTIRSFRSTYPNYI